MKVYTYPFAIEGIATVKADSEAEAILKAAKLCEFLPLSVLQYDDPALPEVSVGDGVSVSPGEPVLVVEEAAPPLPEKPTAAMIG